MADNVTSPISAPISGGMSIPPASAQTLNPQPSHDLNPKIDPVIAEASKPNAGVPKLQEKFKRTGLFYGDTNGSIFEINNWRKYFDNDNSANTGGLYDEDKSGSDETGFMAPEGFYQTDLMSSETGFEKERGWINEPFQNYAFKGSNGNLKLYPGHEGSLENPYSYTNATDLDVNISNNYLEFPDEHIINKLAPQYTFTRGFSIDNDKNDRRLTNINFAQYQTTLNNQDPVVFGYQLAIVSQTSPLFNGAIPDFLYKYSKMTDLKTRLITYYQFFYSFFSLFELEIVRDELRKTTRVDYNNNFTDMDNWYSKIINNNIYTKTDLSDFTNSRTGNNFNKTPYYLKKITGLDKLIEKNGFDGKDNFINYGTDMITLTLNEDTNLSSGALIMLYKTLSWSRRSGKKMIPDNLLRFDLEITVSETRHYNRVIGDKVIADIPNKYTYFLYECQFVFDKMSHGDSIDMSAIKPLDEGVNISFTYKYSNVKMSTYNPKNITLGDGNNPNSLQFNEKSIDNGKLNVYGGVFPIGASNSPSRISSGSSANTYGKRNISGKIGDFGNTPDKVSNPLNNPRGKLPYEMDIANFELSRIRSTVSATIIQPNITSKMKDDIKQLYDSSKLSMISNLNSKIAAGDSKDSNQKVNTNVYSSVYNETDIYNTNPFGQYIANSTIDNVIVKGTYGQDVRVLANTNTRNSIYAENVFLLPDIIPIIGFGFNSPFLSGSAYINLGDDNVYYDRFGLSLNGGFSIGGLSLGGNLSLGPGGLSLGGSLGLNL
jgi:hypothetical protein